MYAMNGLMQYVLRKAVLLQTIQAIFVVYNSNCLLNTMYFAEFFFPLNINTF